ncbi:transglycosylase SLT domain-containing protein [bacterium]|nr:transglycosylase SLT domain-containing protein [bacterium]
MHRKRIVPAIGLLIWSLSARAQQVESVVGGPDSARLYTAFQDRSTLKHIDSLLVLSMDKRSYPMASSALWDSVPPVVSAEVVRARMKQLDARTPLKLTYNSTIQGFIDLYLNRRREQMARMLGEQAFYFPLFEEALERHNMPQELKYLAIVESALRPDATSRVGAKGLWQFMPATGKQYGLEIDSYVDERCDPKKSTDAACRYLKDLYGIFGDWNLALAAYNSGPGNVRKAIRKSGGAMDFWAISPYLPAETRGYVPAFIAVNYAMAHAHDYKLHPLQPAFDFHAVEAVSLTHPMSFHQLSALLSIPTEQLDYLNPVYKKDYVPGTELTPLPVQLPLGKAGLFYSYEDSIRTLALLANQRELEAERLAAETRKQQPETKYLTHKVRRGESLGRIAAKYDVSVSDIKDWNNLRSSTIHTGQRLAIRTSEPAGQRPQTVPVATKPAESDSAKADTGAVAQTTPTDEALPAEAEPKTVAELQNKKPESSVVYYKVQPGDTLYSIARQYPGISANNIMEWNKIRNAKSLKAGTKLKIHVKG